jgi:AbrB family looped-hinge helix DNA binding protein
MSDFCEKSDILPAASPSDIPYKVMRKKKEAGNYELRDEYDLAKMTVAPKGRFRAKSRKGIRMDTVTVSPRFQVVIPLKVRESLGIKPGQKVQVIAYENHIELIPLKPVRKMRGILKASTRAS